MYLKTELLVALTARKTLPSFYGSIHPSINHDRDVESKVLLNGETIFERCRGNRPIFVGAL